MLRLEGFWKAVDQLHETFGNEIGVNVTVYLKDLKDLKCDGYAEMTAAGNFTICVHEHTSYARWIEVLIHEYAHCLDWEESGHLDEHGPSWGCQYARCYQELLAW